MAIEIVRATSTEQKALETFLTTIFDQRSVTVEVRYSQLMFKRYKGIDYICSGIGGNFIVSFQDVLLRSVNPKLVVILIWHEKDEKNRMEEAVTMDSPMMVWPQL